MIRAVKQNNVIIHEDYRDLLKANGLDSFDSMMNYEGGVPVKETRNGSVHYVKLGRQAFYLKRYRGSFKTSIEPFFKLKGIQRDGLKEWENIHSVMNAGIHTAIPVAAGSRRTGLFRSESFLLTEELYGTRKLDEFFRENFMPPLDRKSIRMKRQIIRKLSEIVQRLHESRKSHQDLYLGHFYIRPDALAGFDLYLIDLQRLRESRTATFEKYHRIKDLSQIFFASHYEVSVTNADRLRFYKAYVGGRRLSGLDCKLFDRVLKKAKRIAAHTKKHAYPVPDVSWRPRI